MNKKLLHVGLDVGSTTVKIVIMNDNLETIYTNYRRHFSDTKNTVCDVLEELANKDNSSIAIQKRKWRVCLLKILIDNINGDSLQGMLELMEFWASMGMPNDCPQTIPKGNNKKSIQEYFTPASFEFNLNKNRMWVNEEIRYIIKLEG